MGGMAEYTQQHWQVELINEKQSSWMATTYPHLQGRKLEEIEKMKGGHRSRIFHRPSKPKSSLLTSKFEAGEVLPESFDWRNVSGVNYVPQVRDQGSCGSCYAFSSMGMLEARLRIRTGNTRNFTLSPQDVVSCSPLSQGCEGGFPHLIAGRYGKDYGVVEEECNKYKGNDGQCGTKSNCHRYYVSSYSYVGGYYGACSELEMKRALVRNGPLSVSFEVYHDVQVGSVPQDKTTAAFHQVCAFPDNESCGTSGWVRTRPNGEGGLLDRTELLGQAVGRGRLLQNSTWN